MIFNRDLAAGIPAQVPPQKSAKSREAAANDTSESPSRMAVLARGAAGRPDPVASRPTFLDLQDLFDERPRGGRECELVRIRHDVRIRDQGDAENSGVGQRVEGDADVARVYRGGHYGRCPPKHSGSVGHRMLVSNVCTSRWCSMNV